MRLRLTYANVMATIAVFIALGGASYAAITVPKNSVGTKELKNNAVTTAKIKNEVITAAKVKNGTLTGAQVNASTLGPVPVAVSAKSADTATNAKSADLATNASQLGGKPAGEFQGRLWAVVRADGTLARGAGVISTTGEGGNYEVKFNRDITGCAFAATIGHPADGAEPFGEIEVHIESLSYARDTVGVFTGNSAGNITARGFHLIVAC
jgi:hypothetical protein